MDLDSAIKKASEEAGYAPLKDEQKTCLTEFMKRRDLFAVLPTGYGKTACYVCLPSAFNFYQERPKEESSIIVVISPLTALIKDQVSNLTRRHISAGYVDAESSKDVENDVEKGRYDIVYMSPELMVTKWRGLFASAEYQKRLIGLIIDEAHCVIKWYVFTS